MSQIATITSKRQLTIPVDIYRYLGFKAGQKVIVSKSGTGVKIEPVLSLLDKLAGSVKIPRRLKGLSAEEIIKIARKERFNK
jgi:bifunctional DNA-binding transcriptional regulator/antitoxin component of YhaV-PrlF toxin-antitoxin module